MRARPKTIRALLIAGIAVCAIASPLVDFSVVAGGRAGGVCVGRISHGHSNLSGLATSQALGRGMDSVASCARLAAVHCRTLGVLTGLRLVLGGR